MSFVTSFRLYVAYQYLRCQWLFRRKPLHPNRISPNRTGPRGNGQAQQCLLRRTAHISRPVRQTAPPNLLHKRIAKAQNISVREQERALVPVQGKCHRVVDRAEAVVESHKTTHSPRRTDCASGGQAVRALESPAVSGTSNVSAKRMPRARFTVFRFDR